MRMEKQKYTGQKVRSRQRSSRTKDGGTFIQEGKLTDKRFSANDIKRE